MMLETFSLIQSLQCDKFQKMLLEMESREKDSKQAQVRDEAQLTTAKEQLLLVSHILGTTSLFTFLF
jgi:hypothetical protein